MPYKKYYRKRYRNKLSKRNIFSKKSAKNQAKQIYYLNKKINYIRKTTAPETQTFTTNIVNWVNDVNPNIVSEYNQRIALYEEKLINTDLLTDRIDMKGDLLRVKNITFYGSFTLSPNRTVNYDDVGISQNISLTSPQTVYMRILICKLVQGGGRVPARITQDGPAIGTSGAYKDITPIFGPLVSGLGGQMTVIKQKIIKVNNNNPFKSFKFTLKNKSVGNFKKLENWPTAFGMNELLIYVQYLNPASIQKVVGGGTTSIISPGCVFSMNCKISYVDES